MQPTIAALMVFGVILLAASWILLLFTAFKEDYSWGLASLFVPPVAYLYGLFAWDKAKDALLFAALGLILLVLGLTG